MDHSFKKKSADTPSLVLSSSDTGIYPPLAAPGDLTCTYFFYFTRNKQKYKKSYLYVINCNTKYYYGKTFSGVCSFFWSIEHKYNEHTKLFFLYLFKNYTQQLTFVFKG